MNTTTKTKKKLSIILIAALTVIGLLVASMMQLTTTIETHASQVGNMEIFSEQMLENQAMSLGIAESFMQNVRTELADTDGKSRFVYNEDFAGIFLDENGFLNIATVGSEFSAMAFGANSLESGQVIHRQFTYSYNHLLLIKHNIKPMMYVYDIFTIVIDEINNRVKVHLEDYGNKSSVIRLLETRGLYSENSIEFVVDRNGRAGLTSRSIHGGDGIERGTPGITSGTIGTQAICNLTGQVGILTNEHVLSRERGDVARFNGEFLGNVARGEFRGNIDASFTPFANQTDWIHTPHSRHGGENFTNIRLGNESLIIVGAQLFRIGQRTGRTLSQVTSRNASISLFWNGEWHTISNSFRFSSDVRDWRDIQGDSGGPVYFRGANNTLYLLGLTFAAGNYRGTINHGVEGYVIRMSNIMLPVAQGGLDVTPITNSMFNPTNQGTGVQVNNITVPATTTHVTVPSIINGRVVTHIGTNAFAHVTNLTTVDLPNGLTTVESSAFANRHLLTQISIPSTVTSIGNNAFRDATSLHTITFANNSQLQTIGMDAFRNATSLTNLTIPASVTSIGTRAFENATNLRTVTFAGTSRLQTIGNDAFRNATSLTNLTIPASVTSLGTRAFENATNLRTVTFAGNSQLRTIGNSAFGGMILGLTQVTIPASVTTLGDSAFN